MTQGNYMSDCLHLHACRLVARRYRHAGVKHVARCCNEDCTAYQKATSVYAVEVDDALLVARDGASSIRDGYDEYDVYCAWDFPGEQMLIVENGPMCKDKVHDQ